MLLVEVALGESAWQVALLGLRSVCGRWPHSLVAWNAFSRCAGMGGPGPEPGAWI